jgi:hypothetical protein
MNPHTWNAFLAAVLLGAPLALMAGGHIMRMAVISAGWPWLEAIL